MRTGRRTLQRVEWHVQCTARMTISKVLRIRSYSKELSDFAFLHISVISFRHYICQFICTLSRLMRCKHGKVFGNCWKKTLDRSRDGRRNTDLSIARTWTINQSIISYDSRLKTWLINLQRAGESSIIQLSGLDLPSLFRSFYQSILNLPPQTPT